MNRWSIVVLLAFALVVSGCGKPAEEPVEPEEAMAAEWEKVLPGLMNDTQKAQQELVLTAVNAMAAELMVELTAALDAGDAGAAINVCKEKAPAVAAHVRETYGVKLGRTSHRLRNTANVAPAWAETYVTDMVEDPTYVAGPDGELGALLPINLKAECEMCHGPVEQVDASVMAAINEAYPEDQAVGFEEGDLRGWFWVEAPPGQAVAEEEEMEETAETEA
jgi:hypothetical protein